MKSTIRNTVKEVYNTELKDMNVNTSRMKAFSTPNKLNAAQRVNDVAIDNTNPANIHPTSAQNNSVVLLLLALLFLLATLGVVYYFRNEIKGYFRKWFNPQKSTSKEVIKIKENDEELKETRTVTENKGKHIEKDKLTIEKDGKVVVEDKIVKETQKNGGRTGVVATKKTNNKTHYSDEKLVNQDDMYCYVGKDDNMRQCIQVFKDDICTSGDIFKRIDECLVPR